MVTSAVESQSTPIKSQLGIGAAQRRRCALDRGDLTLEMLAIGRCQPAGIVDPRRSDFPANVGFVRAISDGACRLIRLKACRLVRHDRHRCLSAFLNDQPEARDIHRWLTLTALRN
jgi:hypothetical protein